MSRVTMSIGLVCCMTAHAACAGSSPGAETARRKEGFREHALRRAAFELDCPANEVQLSDLSSGNSGRMGVRGCGRKAVFVWSPPEGWINDTGVQPVRVAE